MCVYIHIYLVKIIKKFIKYYMLILIIQFKIIIYYILLYTNNFNYNI